MIYLASMTSIPEQYQEEFGVMFSALYPVGGLNDALDNGWKWMMDNNQFSGNFDAKTWLTALLKYLPYKENCIGIPIPDVVGNALETLRRFSQYWRVVHDLGYPVAFVSQDGITPEITPWNYFDVLFVGGTNDHKLHDEASIMIAEARERGKRVHIGRVNYPKRLRQFWMADSVDGTGITSTRRRRNGETEEDAMARQLKLISDLSSAVKFCRNKKSGRLGIDGQSKILEVLG